jgi:hypothetical protein
LSPREEAEAVVAAVEEEEAEEVAGVGAEK